MRFRCCMLKCPVSRERTPSSCGAVSEISYHSLPADEPRRTKWLRFIRAANGTEKLEQPVGEVRVCSLHFLPTDFNRHLFVSGALGYAPKRRRLASTAVPSMLLPGQALDEAAWDVEPACAHEGESHNTATPLDIGQFLQVQIELGGSAHAATQTTSQTVGHNKAVQALVVHQRSTAVQVNTMVKKETCDRATGVERGDGVRLAPVPLKRRHPAGGAGRRRRLRRVV